MNSNTVLDILLIQSFDLDGLIEDYRMFFLALIPSMFILSCLIEYFDRLDWLGALKRAVISILILTSVTSFYEDSILASIEAANSKLKSLKQTNILLMDMFEGGKYLDNSKPDSKQFYKDENAVSGSMKFLKYHLFDSFINDGFTISVFFISKICFLIIKVVYSLVYYLGIGLIGVPCIIYLFPTMGNVLRGAILSYIWCLVVPHILVFILSLVGSEINKGYVSGQIIGGSATGTALLFILAIFIAFTPLVAMMLVNGSGMAHAGGIIASIGANYAMNIPKSVTNSVATALTGGKLGPKTQLAKGGAKIGFKVAKGSMLKGRDVLKSGKTNTMSSQASSNKSIQSQSSNLQSTNSKDSSKTNNSSKSQNTLNRDFSNSKQIKNDSSKMQKFRKSESENKLEQKKSRTLTSKRSNGGQLPKYNQSNRIHKKTNDRF